MNDIDLEQSEVSKHLAELEIKYQEYIRILLED